MVGSSTVLRTSPFDPAQDRLSEGASNEMECWEYRSVWALNASLHYSIIPVLQSVLTDRRHRPFRPHSND
jgi:hypothetical protein